MKRRDDMDKKTMGTLGVLVILGMFVFMSLPESVYAPPANPWKVGGNTEGADSTLGSSDNYDVIVITNNNERMRITNDGKIGIGTASPAETLHVVGNANITGSLEVGSLNVDYGILYIDESSNKVGINTTNPTYNFEVHGEMVWFNSSIIKFGNTSFCESPWKDSLMSTRNYRIIFDEDDETTDYYFAVGVHEDHEKHTPAWDTSERFWIRENSSTGVGVKNPLGRLWVQSIPYNGAGKITSSGTTVSGSGTSFTTDMMIGSEIWIDIYHSPYQKPSDWQKEIRRVDSITSDTSLVINSPYSTDLSSWSDYNYTRPILSVETIERVGISTTSPKEKLDVNGAIRMGYTSYTNTGTIRWNPTTVDFEGYDGTVWKSLTGGSGTGGNTLDQAYDQGGAGAGRTIIADSGAVEIASTGGLRVNADVSIGLSPAITPVNTLDVAGNAVVGTVYAGSPTTTAPPNGMLIEGTVGIGNPGIPVLPRFPSGMLHVDLWNPTVTPSTVTEVARIGCTSPTGISDNAVAIGVYDNPTTPSLGEPVIQAMDQTTWSPSGASTTDLFINPKGFNTILNNEFGSVGIGISAPLARLHVDGGGLLVTGETGSTPTSGAGTRLMWIPEKAAFRSGVATGPEWDNANIGMRSTAMGASTEASGSNSTAMGASTVASGLNSTAMGAATAASGQNSTAMGTASVASGFMSTAIGSFSVSSGTASIAMGTYATATDDSAIAMGYSTVASGRYSTAMGIDITANGDYSFGIGLDGKNPNWVISQDNVMAIMGGKVGIGTTNPLAKLHLDGGGLLATGTTGSTPTSGAGTRLMWIPEKAAFRSGVATGSVWDDANIGMQSTAMGINTTASGDNSTAIGNVATAQGDNSTALGNYAHASGENSFAIGNHAYATKMNSTAIGDCANARGVSSVAIGRSTHAQGERSTALGSYTTSEGYGSTAMGTWIISRGKYSFGIGLDYDESTNPIITRDNIMAIMNGEVGINTTDPQTTLDVDGGFATQIFSVSPNESYDVHSGEKHDFTILVNASSGVNATKNITLPSIVSHEGQIIVIKKIDNSSRFIDIIPSGTDTIEEGYPWNHPPGVFRLENRWDSVVLQAYNTGTTGTWYVLASNL